MIYDQLKNLKKYKNFHPNLGLVIEYLENIDIDSLPLDWRYSLDENILFMIQDKKLNSVFTGEYEYHKKYIDLHIIIDGEETIAYGFGNITEIKEYSNKNDYGLVFSSRKQELYLSPKYFALFLPNEAHEPNRMTEKSKKVRKCIVKIAV
ncbi:YhcH/YjgK/YiaL family protein [Enterococcus gallinarum]|uniref:YhcH/YjgK/YiaL family protein n=1 Tax=Enterococcus gallinarum TaxID=1353 RepID=UPI0012AB3FBF|nr:YhcH/YjgK/YiaL family protein [Enterococcus gallinarum]